MAIGFIAGPLRPANVFAKYGCLVFISIFIPTKVFTADTASAPMSLAAFANCVISVTLGDSFTISAPSVTLRTFSSSCENILIS